MGLFSKAAALAGLVKSTKLFNALERPGGYTGPEWDSILFQLNEGNQQLVDAMSHGSISSNWEHGGILEPHVGRNYLAPYTTKTSRSPTEVAIEMSNDPMKSMVYHSHPHDLIAETGEHLPPALSIGDLEYALNKERGITSLDPQGGMAWAIRDDAAPKVDRETWAKIRNDAQLAAASVFPDTQGWTRHGVVARDRSRFDPEFDASDQYLAATLGMGQALKNRGVLSHFGRAPGTEAQQAGAALLEPAVKSATAAAEDTIARWLKERGYSDGVIKSIIGSMLASGTLLTAANDLMSQQEA